MINRASVYSRTSLATINTYDITLIHHHYNVINHPSWLDTRRIAPEYQAMIDDGDITMMMNEGDCIGINQVPLSDEGRVEHQKLNQTTP